MAISLVPNNSNVEISVHGQKWYADDDGFARSKAAALMQAQTELQQKAKSVYQDIADRFNFVDAEVTVDGVPIDMGARPAAGDALTAVGGVPIDQANIEKI